MGHCNVWEVKLVLGNLYRIICNYLRKCLELLRQRERISDSVDRAKVYCIITRWLHHWQNHWKIGKTGTRESGGEIKGPICLVLLIQFCCFSLWFSAFGLFLKAFCSLFSEFVGDFFCIVGFFPCIFGFVFLHLTTISNESLKSLGNRLCTLTYWPQNVIFVCKLASRVALCVGSGIGSPW